MADPKPNTYMRDNPSGDSGGPIRPDKGMDDSAGSPPNARRAAFERSRRLAQVGRSSVLPGGEDLSSSLARLSEMSVQRIAHRGSTRMGVRSRRFGDPSQVFFAPRWPVQVPNRPIGLQDGTPQGANLVVDLEWTAAELTIAVLPNRRSIKVPVLPVVLGFGCGAQLYVYNRTLVGNGALLPSAFYWGDAKSFVISNCPQPVIRQLKSETIVTVDPTGVDRQTQVDPPGGGFAVDGNPAAPASDPYQTSGVATGGVGWHLDLPGLPDSFMYDQFDPGWSVRCDFLFQTWFECAGAICGYYEWGFKMTLGRSTGVGIVGGTVTAKQGMLGQTGTNGYGPARAEFRRLTGK